jgi:5-methylcytosine-specific restriction endonuclease McrA
MLRTCEVCGKEFQAPPCLVKIGGGRFCSLACKGMASRGKPTWNKGDKMQRVCKQCGASFEVVPSAMSNGSGSFCSHACYAESLRKPVEHVCENCGAAFVRTPSEDARYCSRACMIEHCRGANHPTYIGPVALTCKHCGKSFTVPRTRRYKNHPYCSDPCAKAYWRTHPEESPRWAGGRTIAQYHERKQWQYRDWRKAVFERDDFTCRQCGARGGRIQAHHLYPYSAHPHLRLDVGNGLTLCKECHKAIRGKESDLLIRLGWNPAQPPLSLMAAG